MNPDSHAGWEMLPLAVFGLAWLGARMYLTVNTEEARAGKILPDPPWLGPLGTIFIFSASLSKGLAIIADRLTTSRPDFFPLIYLGLFVVYVAPLLILKPPIRKFSWREFSLASLYMVSLTPLFALDLKSRPDDMLRTPFLWLIPLLVVTVFLVTTCIFSKKFRPQTAIATLAVAAFIVWIGLTKWFATLIH